MKRLALIAVAGFFAFALSACGEQHNDKQPTVTDNTHNMQQQNEVPTQQQPTEEQSQ